MSDREAEVQAIAEAWSKAKTLLYEVISLERPEELWWERPHSDRFWIEYTELLGRIFWAKWMKMEPDTKEA